MRDDQYQNLQKLSEKLTDVVLAEADPATWPGEGKAMASLTRDERGDRYWSKKNAAATLSVLMRVHTLIGVTERTLSGSGTPTDPQEAEKMETELDKEVRAAEKEARRILSRVQAQQRQRAKSN